MYSRLQEYDWRGKHPARIPARSRQKLERGCTPHTYRSLAGDKTKRNVHTSKLKTSALSGRWAKQYVQPTSSSMTRPVKNGGRHGDRINISTAGHRERVSVRDVRRPTSSNILLFILPCFSSSLLVATPIRYGIAGAPPPPVPPHGRDAAIQSPYYVRYNTKPLTTIPEPVGPQRSLVPAWSGHYLRGLWCTKVGRFRNEIKDKFSEMRLK